MDAIKKTTYMTRLSQKQLDALAMANAGPAYLELQRAVKEHNAMAERVGAHAVRIPLGLPMTHTELQDAIATLAIALGYRVFHTQTIQTANGGHMTAYKYPTSKGFVDLELVHEAGKGILYIECKVGRDKLSPEQEEWQEAYKSNSANHYVFRPADWHSGRVEQILGRGF